MMRLLGLYLLEDTSALFLRIGPPRYGRTTGPRGWEPSPPFRSNPFDRGGNLIGKAAFTQIEFAMDSPLEGDGFELPVPRAMQARLNAKIAGSSYAVRNSRGRNCSFGGRRGVGIGSPITRNRGLSTVRKIVVGADVVIGLSSLIFLSLSSILFVFSEEIEQFKTSKNPPNHP